MSRIAARLPVSAERGPSWDPAWRRLPGTWGTPVVAALVLLWLGIVLFTASRHEFWRDEVRALSLVRAAASPGDLYTLIQYDGHPVLWYALLYVATALADTPLVLPATSILVALAAVVLVMAASPFPVWWRVLVVFSGLPLYEYSVMARNYGISMLLLFTAAVLYRVRRTHPIWLAAVLALLANTNVHSVILVGAFAGFWAWDAIVDRRRGVAGPGIGWLVLALAIIAAGIGVCAAFAFPRENTIVTPVRDSLEAGRVAMALFDAAVRPHRTFPDLLPGALPGVIAAAVLAAAAGGLLFRPNLFLAAVSVQLGFGVLFRVAYPGSYRHQGLYLLFLVVLYWIYLDTARERARAAPRTTAGHLLSRVGLYGAMVVLLAANIAAARRLVLDDVTRERSSSKRFGSFLRGSPVYRDAIILAEPDFFMESLPYYTGNPLYLPREARFSPTVSWTTDSRMRLTLGELLLAARTVRHTSDSRPVLIVLAWNLETRPAGEKRQIYGKVFSWTSEELADFRRSTALIGEFTSAYGDENYRVYHLQ